MTMTHPRHPSKRPRRSPLLSALACAILVVFGALAPMASAKESMSVPEQDGEPAHREKAPPRDGPPAMAEEELAALTGPVLPKPLRAKGEWPEPPGVELPGVRALARPDNDNFANARVVEVDMAYVQSTSGATVESGEPLPCGALGATVWFQVTVPTSGTLIVYTDPSDYDTVLAAYSQRAGTRGATLACNDDVDDTLNSRVSFPVTAGRTYYLQGGGYFGDTGMLALQLHFVPCGTNDHRVCSTGIASNPSRATASTAGFTLEAGEPRPCGGMAATAWYKYTAATAQSVVVDTGGSTFDTVLAVFVDDDDALGALVACNDDGVFGQGSAVRFTTSPGTSYFIQLGGYYGATGQASLTLAPCATNDHVGCAPSVASSAETRSTSAYTLEAGERRPCGSIGKTAWWSYTPTTTRTMTVDTAGSSFDTVLAAYAGSVTSTSLVCIDDTSTSRQARITFTAYAGQTYYIQAGGYDSASGLLQMTFS